MFFLLLLLLLSQFLLESRLRHGLDEFILLQVDLVLGLVVTKL